MISAFILLLGVFLGIAIAIVVKSERDAAAVGGVTVASCRRRVRALRRERADLNPAWRARRSA